MLQILISLGILALWALTSLLSREAQPLPPRPTRSRLPEGPRPSPSFPRNDQVPTNLGRETSDRSPGGLGEGRLAARSSDSSTAGSSASARPAPPYIEIRILEPAPRGTRSAASTGGSSSYSPPPARGRSRRSSRSRAAASPPTAKSADPGQPRALTSQINKSMAQAMGRPLEMAPLEVSLPSLSTSHIPLDAKATTEPLERPGPALDAPAIRAMLRSPGKLRDIAILSELLKPPVALRPRGRSR